MRLVATDLVSVAALLGGAGVPAPHAAPRVAATSEPPLSTREGPALRVGPPGSERFVGLLANGEGAFGVAVAADGAFLAFTCGMAARVDVWFSGTWYRGRLTAEHQITVTELGGERLKHSRTPVNGLAAEVTTSDCAPVLSTADPATTADGLFRRGDADAVLGAIALPGNTVCTVKRTDDGRVLPAGMMPY